MQRIPFYFDFISPYSWLVLREAEGFAARHDIAWEPRPVVYAALLDAAGLLGPGEVEVKRRYAFRDVRRCAHRIGVTLVGPPAHPFRSLEALRTMCLFRGHERGMALAVGLADACWGQGEDLTDLEVVASVVTAAGLDAESLAQRIATPEVKDELKKLTADAITMGVFGVPTFVYGDELFWGQDRMPQLGARLRGEIPAPDAADEEMLRRPRGADRKQFRGRSR